MQKTAQALWNTAQENMPDLLPGPEEHEPSETQIVLDILTRRRISVATLDFLGYQYSGNGLSTQVSQYHIPTLIVSREIIGGVKLKDWAAMPDLTERMAQRLRQ